MNLLKFYSIPIFALLLVSMTSHGQDKMNAKNYYQWFDSKVGIQNKKVFNGTLYIEKYRTINEKHKFLISTQFQKGVMHFNGQPFFGLELKYDIYEDELLLNSKSTAGTVLRLQKKRIDSFTIASRKFVNLRQVNQPKTEISGFYEILLETSLFTLLKKNQKSILKKVRKELVYYEFKSNNKRYLFYKDTYYPLKKKKDVTRLFPELKRTINLYYKKSNTASDTDSMMKALLKKIEFELLQKAEPIQWKSFCF